MKIRTTIAAAAAIAGTGAFVLPAAASASTTTHTLKFTAEMKSSAALSNSAEAEQDTDVNSAGNVIGYDMLYLEIASSTRVAINVTVDVNGGMLYGTATLNAKGVVSNGKVPAAPVHSKAPREHLRSRTLTRRGPDTRSRSPIAINNSGQTPPNHAPSAVTSRWGISASTRSSLD